MLHGLQLDPKFLRNQHWAKKFNKKNAKKNAKVGSAPRLH